MVPVHSTRRERANASAQLGNSWDTRVSSCVVPEERCSRGPRVLKEYEQYVRMYCVCGLYTEEGLSGEAQREDTNAEAERQRDCAPGDWAVAEPALAFWCNLSCSNSYLLLYIPLSESKTQRTLITNTCAAGLHAIDKVDNWGTRLAL